MSLQRRKPDSNQISVVILSCRNLSLSAFAKGNSEIWWSRTLAKWSQTGTGMSSPRFVKLCVWFLVVGKEKWQSYTVVNFTWDALVSRLHYVTMPLLETNFFLCPNLQFLWWEKNSLSPEILCSPHFLLRRLMVFFLHEVVLKYKQWQNSGRCHYEIGQNAKVHT